MSADATCRGLRSATDGPFLMQLTRGIQHNIIMCPVVTTISNAVLTDTTRLPSDGHSTAYQTSLGSQ